MLATTLLPFKPRLVVVWLCCTTSSIRSSMSDVTVKTSVTMSHTGWGSVKCCNIMQCKGMDGWELVLPGSNGSRLLLLCLWVWMLTVSFLDQLLNSVWSHTYCPSSIESPWVTECARPVINSMSLRFVSLVMLCNHTAMHKFTMGICKLIRSFW